MKDRKLQNRLKNNIVWLSALLLAACQSNTVYHSYQPAPLTGWNKSDTLIYTLPSTIPTGAYELEIGIRHQEIYPYQNLWLGIAHNMKDSLTYTKDSLELILADKDGNWKGVGPGGLYQYTQTFKKSVYIDQEGNSRTFRIYHIMSDKPLKGVSDIGVKLTKK